MKRNIAGLILSGLMVVLLTACGESGANPEGPPETITLDGVTYIVIVEESDFDKMRDDPTGNYYLWRDIALTGDFEPIAPDIGTDPYLFKGTPFTGIFEGNNKTISNLRIAKSTENYVGFFGQIGSATPVDSDANGAVRNLTLVLTAGTVDNPSIKGVEAVGALAGKSYGKIEAVGVEGGFVKGDINVGGLVGNFAGGGNITSSYATGSVTGGQGVGGLVGVLYGNITSSYATGSVTGSRDYVGGLVGYANSGTIERSYATGSVTLTGTGSNIGGLVGAIAGGTINSSYFDSSTEGTNQTNGIGRDDNNQSVTGITTSGITSGGREPFAGVGWNFDGDDAVWAAQGDGQWLLLAWQ